MSVTVPPGQSSRGSKPGLISYPSRVSDPREGDGGQPQPSHSNSSQAVSAIQQYRIQQVGGEQHQSASSPSEFPRHNRRSVEARRNSVDRGSFNPSDIQKALSALGKQQQPSITDAHLEMIAGALRSVAALAHFGPEELRKLAGLATEKHIGLGQVLFSNGQRCMVRHLVSESELSRDLFIASVSVVPSPTPIHPKMRTVIIPYNDHRGFRCFVKESLWTLRTIPWRLGRVRIRGEVTGGSDDLHCMLLPVEHII